MRKRNILKNDNIEGAKFYSKKKKRDDHKHFLSHRKTPRY